jgi:hypothetical protein
MATTICRLLHSGLVVRGRVLDRRDVAVKVDRHGAKFTTYVTVVWGGMRVNGIEIPLHDETPPNSAVQ